MAPLFKKCSGHIALLPQPKLRSAYALKVVKLFQKAGVMKHVRVLSRRELVNPTVFNAQRFWLVLYLGDESFYETVRHQGDALEAIRRFLADGGTLALLAKGPFPFFYNEQGETVVAARKLGIPICGSGIAKRPDTLKNVSVRGWERPPKGAKLAFYRRPNQEIVTSTPETFPYPKKGEGDLRWRPIVEWLPPGNRYVPIVTLRDAEGKSYGEAAALVEFKAGGRVLYVWCSLLSMPNVRLAVLSDVMRFLLQSANPPPSRALCPRTNEPPTIDGRLDEPIWRALPPVGEFTCFGTKRGAPSRRTQAKWCWDEHNLYIAFTCDDPDVWSTLSRRDGHLWEGEVVEAYIDPDGDGRNYKEFEVNPLNAVIDLNIEREENGRVADPDKFARWNAAGWSTAVRVNGTLNDRTDRDKGWAVEMAIPLKNFATAKRLPPRVGDIWRVQLLRIERPKASAKPEFSAWSSTDTFHRPTRFGR